MTLADFSQTQADGKSPIRLRFDFILLLGVIALAPFCAAAVDLWAQTLIHLIVIVLAYRLTLKEEVKAQCSKTLLWLWAYILFTLGFSMLHSGAPVRSQQEFWMWVDYAIVFYLTGQLSMIDQKKLLDALFWPWSLLCLWALGQFYFYHHAPQASLLNPNLLAGYLILPLFVCLETLNRQSTQVGKKVRLGLLLFLVLAGWTLIQTRSTGAFLGFVSGMLYLGIRAPKTLMRNRYWLLIALPILAGSLFWKLSQGGDPHRWSWWQVALQMASVHPFIGLGPGTYEMAIPHLRDLHLYSLYAHNTFLQWLSENGILFLIGLLVFWSYALWKSTRPFLAAGLIAIIVHNAVDYSLMIPANALLFWSLFSLSCGPWTIKGTASHRISLPSRVAWLAVGSAGIWLALAHFQADRYQAMAIAAFQRGEYSQAARLSENATQLSPRTATPYDLRSRLALRKADAAAGQGPLIEALANQLSALEREPVQTVYGLSAIQLYKAIGMPQAADQLRQEMLAASPYLRNDKRF